MLNANWSTMFCPRRAEASRPEKSLLSGIVKESSAIRFAQSFFLSVFRFSVMSLRLSKLVMV